MLDACVLYKISNEEEKQFSIKIGNAIIKDKLNFNKTDLVFFSPPNPKKMREAIDKTLPYGIINSELLHEKDSPHYPRAGIDDTVAKIMARKKIAIVFNINLLLTFKKAKRANIIRRMKENMKRAVKYDIPVLFASCAHNKFELFNGLQIKTLARYLGIDNFKRVKTSFEKIFS